MTQNHFFCCTFDQKTFKNGPKARAILEGSSTSSWALPSVMSTRTWATLGLIPKDSWKSSCRTYPMPFPAHTNVSNPFKGEFVSLRWRCHNEETFLLSRVSSANLFWCCLPRNAALWWPWAQSFCLWSRSDGTRRAARRCNEPRRSERGLQSVITDISINRLTFLISQGYWSKDYGKKYLDFCFVIETYKGLTLLLFSF